MKRRLGAFIIALCMILLMTNQSSAQPASIPSHREIYILDSGRHDGLLEESLVAFRATIRIPGIPWLRVHFSDYHLGEGSYITITSLEDGSRQRLKTKSMTQWRKSSAYFNGDAVEIKLHVAPGEKGVFFVIKEITVGEWIGPRAASKNICWDEDQRYSSEDSSVGRTMPHLCTGYIISNGAHLSAGHCADVDSFDVLEFNVPPSYSDGTPKHSGAEHQYAIDSSSVVYHEGTPGTDWAVFGCFPNDSTGLIPAQAQGAFYRLALWDELSPPDSAHVTGYGDDEDPLEDNNTQQTDTGRFLGEARYGFSIHYLVDTRIGNSGSPVIIYYDTTAVSIGIHTKGDCFPDTVNPSNSQGNKGTSFYNSGLQSAIQEFPGANTIYVDDDHPEGEEDGTIFRPYDQVGEAVDQLTGAGETICIVTGSYAETDTIDEAARLIAPVGPVIIGE